MASSQRVKHENAYLELSLFALQLVDGLSKLHRLGDLPFATESLDIHQSGTDLLVEFEDFLCLKKKHESRVPQRSFTLTYSAASRLFS